MLKLSKLTDYAVAICTKMATNQKSFSVAELSETLNFPAPTISKILKLLAKKKIVQSQRGKLGGYVLSKESASITLLEIIEAIDGPVFLIHCSQKPSSNSACLMEAVCLAKSPLSIISSGLRALLSQTTLDQIVNKNLKVWSDFLRSAS